jgi:hypothetical protein
MPAPFVDSVSSSFFPPRPAIQFHLPRVHAALHRSGWTGEQLQRRRLTCNWRDPSCLPPATLVDEEVDITAYKREKAVKLVLYTSSVPALDKILRWPYQVRQNP